MLRYEIALKRFSYGRPIYSLASDETVRYCEHCGYAFAERYLSHDAVWRYAFRISWLFLIAAAIIYSVLFLGIFQIGGIIPYFFAMILGELMADGIRYLIIKSKLHKLFYSPVPKSPETRNTASFPNPSPLETDPFSRN